MALDCSILLLSYYFHTPPGVIHVFFTLVWFVPMTFAYISLNDRLGFIAAFAPCITMGLFTPFRICHIIAIVCFLGGLLFTLLRIYSAGGFIPPITEGAFYWFLFLLFNLFLPLLWFVPATLSLRYADFNLRRIWKIFLGIPSNFFWFFWIMLPLLLN